MESAGGGNLKFEKSEESQDMVLQGNKCNALKIAQDWDANLNVVRLKIDVGAAVFENGGSGTKLWMPEEGNFECLRVRLRSGWIMHLTGLQRFILMIADLLRRRFFD